MGYSTVQHVNQILANSLTTGTAPSVNGSPTPLLNFGSSVKTNLVSENLVYQYISWADDEINASLSQMYAVPLSEKVDLELEILSDINEYNDTIELSEAKLLNIGDAVVFIDGNQEERHIVDSVENNHIITLQDTLVGFYSYTSARVLRIKYPDPIPLISARLSAANIYDKFFSGAVAPNESAFGKHLRSLARRDLNSILNGRIILHGARRIGRRFYEPNLVDRYGLPSIDGDSSRDMGESSQ